MAGYVEEYLAKRANALNVEELAGPRETSAWDTLLAPITTIGHVLDTPGSVVRGLIAGEPGRAVEGIFDPEQRVTGPELLTKAGWEGDGLGKTLAGLGLEVFLDPTLPLTFGTKAGAAVKALQTVTKDVEIVGKMAIVGDRAAAEVLPHLLTRQKVAAEALGDASLMEIVGRVDKAKAGTWGMSYGFGESRVPLTGVNTLLAKGADAVEGVGRKLLDVPVVGPSIEGGKSLFKKVFDTSLPGEAEKLSAAVEASIQKRGFELRELELQLNKQIDEAIKGTQWKNVDEFKEAVATNIQIRGIPKALDDDLAARSALIMEKTNLKLEKLDADIAALRAKPAAKLPNRKGIPLDDRAGIELIDAETALDRRVNSVEYLQKAREKELKIAANKIEAIRYHYEGIKQELSSKFELVNRYGDLPEQFTKSLEQAGLLENIWWEQSMGLPALQSSEQFVNYIKHSLTDQGRALMAASPEFEAKYVRLTGDGASFMKPRAIRNMTLDEINLKIEKEFGVKGAFETDPIRLVVQRRLESEVTMARTRGVLAAIGLEAVDMPKEVLNTLTAKLGEEVAVAPKGFISVAKVLEDQGLRGIVDPADGAFISFINPLTGDKEIGRTLERIGLADKMIPQSTYDALTKVEKFNLPDGVEKFMREVVDPINGAFRMMLTSIPGFTGQNVISNSWANWLAGVDSKYYSQAVRELGAYHLEHNPNSPIKKFFNWVREGKGYDAKNLSDAVAYGSLNKNVVGELKVMLNPARESITGADQTLFVAEGIRQAEKFVKKVPGMAAYGQGMLDLNQYAEEVAKYAHFLSKRAEGLDPIAAGESVKKYLFDYSDLTSVEKKVMKRGVLFYTFTRKNIPFSIQESFMNKKAFLVQRAIEHSQTDEYVPESIKGTSSVQVAPNTFLNVKDPLLEGNIFSSQGQGPQRTFDRMANMLSPTLKVPLSLFSGRDFYTGKETTPAQTLMSSLPTNRYTNLFSGLSDGVTAVPTLVGQTGMKLSVLDAEKTKFQVLRGRLRAKIQANGEASTYKEYRYNTDTPSPEIQSLLKALRSVNKSSAALYKKPEESPVSRFY